MTTETLPGRFVRFQKMKTTCKVKKKRKTRTGVTKGGVYAIGIKKKKMNGRSLGKSKLSFLLQIDKMEQRRKIARRSSLEREAPGGENEKKRRRARHEVSERRVPLCTYAGLRIRF